MSKKKKDPEDELQIDLTMYAIPTGETGCVVLMMTVAGLYYIWYLAGQVFDKIAAGFGF